MHRLPAQMQMPQKQSTVQHLGMQQLWSLSWRTVLIGWGQLGPGFYLTVAVLQYRETKRKADCIANCGTQDFN